MITDGLTSGVEIGPELRAAVQRVVDDATRQWNASVFVTPLPCWMGPATDSGMAHALQFGRATEVADAVELDRLLNEDPGRLLGLVPEVERGHKIARRHQVRAERRRRKFEVLRRRVIGGHWTRVARRRVRPLMSARPRERGRGARRAGPRRSTPRATRAGPGGDGSDSEPVGSDAALTPAGSRR